MTLAVIIPAYNEANRIRPTLEEYTRHFTKHYGNAVEVVVVLNIMLMGLMVRLES